MSGRNRSAESIEDFFESSKAESHDRKSKENETPGNSAIAALIRTQPVVHQHRNSSETRATTNSKKTPLTTSIQSTPVKTKHLDSPPAPTVTTNYDSDFDEVASIVDKNKHTSLPQSKERSPMTPRPESDPKLKLKTSYTKSNSNARRKERILPHIRPKTRTKRLKNEVISDMKQRVLSAQHQKVSELESRLAELRRQLESERFENKTLRVIQKREEKALKKYEDQECDVHKVARDYTQEIAEVNEKITHERESKIQLEKEIEDRNEQLHDQTKRIRYYHKLVEQEPELDPSDDLRERLKDADRRLKKYEQKVVNNDKEIENLEKTYRHEIHQELVKERDLKYELQDHAKRYTDLQQQLEKKSRQLGTMHIYIQRGGRRPSNSSSLNLYRTRSLQSLEDNSPRFRAKILEYDKKRREEVRLKPKSKPKPLPIAPPPKPARKKYVPDLTPKPKPIKTYPVPAYLERPPTIEEEFLPAPVKPPTRRLPTPTDDIEDEIIIEPIRPKPPSPIPTRKAQPPVEKRPPTPPRSPSPEPRISTNSIPITASLFKPTEPKPRASRPLDDTWSDIFETKKTEESARDERDDRNKVTTTKPSLPSLQRPSMIMFEPSSIVTNGNQNKPPARLSTTNSYDFDQAVMNLHEGKPVTGKPTNTKPSADLFDALFENNKTKSTTRLHNRDDTFTTTTTQDQSDPFNSIFTHSSSSANATTAAKPTSRPTPTQNDKLQRPKLVTNIPRPIPNRTVVEEIEEFVL